MCLRLGAVVGLAVLGVGWGRVTFESFEAEIMCCGTVLYSAGCCACDSAACICKSCRLALLVSVMGSAGYETCVADWCVKHSSTEIDIGVVTAYSGTLGLSWAPLCDALLCLYDYADSASDLGCASCPNDLCCPGSRSR